MQALVIESKYGVGDTLTVSAPDSDGDVIITIDEPWSGNSEVGFGDWAEWYLTKDQAKILMEHLRKCFPEI